MTRNPECAACGITAADLPYEETGLDRDDAVDMLFERIDGIDYCQGCAHDQTDT